MTREQVYAAHFFGTALELKLFLGAILLGMLLGAVFDILRALRMSIKHCQAAVFVEDLVFVLFFGISFYSYCTELCRGSLRFFVFVGMAIGFFAYIATFGRIVSKMAAFLIGIFKRALWQLGKVFKKIVGFLCVWPFFGQNSEKVEENPCAEGEL